MKVNLTLSLVHHDHLHGISKITMENNNLTSDELIDQFSIKFAKELTEVMSLANQVKNELLLIPLLALQGMDNPLNGLASAVYLLAKQLEIKEIIIVLECDGVTKTVNPTKRLYS